MAPEGDERGGKFEDLFEDLDKFFAQGNPAGGGRLDETRDDRGEAPGVQERAGRSGAEETPDAGPTPAPVQPGEDLLPPGWEPDIKGLDLVADSADAPASDHRGRDPEDRQGDPPDATRDESSDSFSGAYQPEGEMTGTDWSRLRDAVGEHEGADDFESSTESDAEEYERLGEDEGGAEERRDLSLEDLKKAPPEYRNLPPPPEEESPAADEDDVAVTGDEGAPVVEAEASQEEPLLEAGTDWEPSRSPEEPAGQPSWDEPGLSDVEAAADNLAASFAGTTGPVEEDLLADIEEPEGPRTVRVGTPESLSGPTWEEPTSAPLLPDQGGAPQPARNLPAAVLTAAVLALVALVSLWVAKGAFAVVASAVVLLGQAELYATMQRKGHQPAAALGLVVGAFTLAGAYLRGEQAMLFFVALGVILSLLWYMAAVPKAREGALANIGSTMLGVLYVPFLAGYILLILAQARSGKALMLAVLGLTFIYDIAAFLVGSGWGSRALAPTISPKKSWEGLLGATAVTFALAVAILPSIEPLNLVKSVGLALVVALFAPLGDLAESSIKRDLGVKDMGSVLPGHGGILDRIDSVLFVAPAAFYFLRLVF